MKLALPLACAAVLLAACGTTSHYRDTGYRAGYYSPSYAVPPSGGSIYRFNDHETICHKGKTLTVAPEALDAHLRHGDTRGGC
jgi:hypothetical protein